MKRHGDNPTFSAHPPISAAKLVSQSRNWLTDVLHTAVSPPFFWQKVASIDRPNQNFEEPQGLMSSRC
jgi:hypothetical protein